MAGSIVSLPLTPRSSPMEHTDSSTSNSTVKPEKRPGKIHSKSRRGCYDCKRRKIKCQETRPRCENCARLGLCCRYGPNIAVPSPNHSCTLNVHRSFSLTDMRLYHHFLNAAYPHFPVRNDNVWLYYIIPIGHQCEYLMHAMLALAASHLEKLAPNGMTTIAQYHRLNAIKGLNAALEKPLKNAEEGDAAIATCYALFMQSWYMDDGLQASLVLTRSSDLTTKRVQAQQIGSIFAQESSDTRLDSMRSRIKDCPSFDLDFIHSAILSTNALIPLCEYEFERTLLEGLVVAFKALADSPVKAYCRYLAIDKMIIGMDHDEISRLLDPSNPSCQLILAHIVALHLTMRPISCRERKHYTVTMYSIRMCSWIPTIYNTIRAEYRDFLAWPGFVGKMHIAGVLEKYTLASCKRCSQEELEAAVPVLF